METRRKLTMEELGRLSVPEFKNSEKLPVVVLLDNVRSLHNVGSAFRTCDAFRVTKLYLTGITGTPPHREIHKAALGATDSVPWEYAENAAEAVRQLKNDGFKILVVEQTTKSISLQKFDVEKTEKFCLVFGNEVDGVSDAIISLSDTALEIPQSGTKHSLNISVCTGIVLWHFYNQIAL